MDLKQAFGEQYRVKLDESYTAETWAAGYTAKENKHWFYEIRGQHGTVYENNSETVVMDLNPRAARKLGWVKGSWENMKTSFPIRQASGERIAFVIPNTKLADVIWVINPYKKRQVSSEQRAKLIERLAKMRLKLVQNQAPDTGCFPQERPLKGEFSTIVPKTEQG